MEKTITVQAAAKINLSLGITGQRSDGYHLLETVMQSVSLYDRISLQWNHDEGGIRIRSDSDGVPLDHGNICYNAAKAWMKAAGLTGGLTITIHKQIPMEAGLGGGSTDAAAVLFALSLLGKPLPDPEHIREIAVAAGADVPFCLQGGIAFCEGIGERITQLSPMPSRPVLLLKPPFGLSTPAVFRQLHWTAGQTSPSHDRILSAIRHGNWTQLGQVAFNCLLEPACQLAPDLSGYLALMRQTNASLVSMSGSGTSVFGIYENEESCDAAEWVIRRAISKQDQLFRLSTIQHGQHVIHDAL